MVKHKTRNPIRRFKFDKSRQPPLMIFSITGALRILAATVDDDAAFDR